MAALSVCPFAELGRFKGVADALAAEGSFSREARYYKKLPEKRVECALCPRKCTVADKERGYCGVRENVGGVYHTLVHSRACTVHVDPIEKKPLFHFKPGTTALSIATAGCNVECRFCQNWQISQFRPEQVESIYLPPDRIYELASRWDAPSIAYTYNEPVIFCEYVYDTAALGKEKGVRNVMISNGYIQREPMSDLCKVLDAVKIDLKGFTESFYKDVCSGELKPVLDTLVLLAEKGIWYEIVVLLIPTLNDSVKEIKQMSEWIVNNLGSDVPVHFSRYYPTYKMKNLPRTPIRTVERARKTAMDRGINFVYVGNVPGHPGESTYCPSCGEVLVRRIGFQILENKLKNGKCPKCGRVIPGVW